MDERTEGESDGRADGRTRRTSGLTAGRTAGRTDGQQDISRDSAKRPPFPRFPAGNWLFPGAYGFTTVYGTSRWQGLAHLTGSPPAGSLPCFYDSRKKFVHFGLAQPGRARLVRAHACRGQNSDFEKILCQNVRHNLEAFWRFYASETPILKNRRNVFRIGTYLRTKMNIRIREHVRIFQ